MSRAGRDRAWLRWALGIAGAAAVCVAVAALAYRSLPELVPEDRLRGAVEAHAATWSGGKLRLLAGAEVSMGRGPMITLDDAEFRGTLGGAEWRLDVASVQATFRMLPLLQGRVEIETLILDAPRLRLRDHDDTAAPASPEVPTAEREHPSPVGELIVTDASIVYEGATRRQIGIGGIDLRLAAEPDSSALLLTGALPAGQRRLHVQARLEDPASAFTGSGSEARLALRGAADDAGTPPPLRPDVPAAAGEGKVVSALRRIAAAIGLSGLGPLALEGRFSLTPRSLEIADATMSVSGVLAEGDLAIALEGEEAPSEQLDRVMRGAAAAWHDASAAMAAGAWRKAPVALDWLAPLGVLLSARLRDSRLAGTDLEARRIRLDASGGRARLEVVAAGDLGQLRGELALGTDPGSGLPQVAVNGRLEDVALGEAGRTLLTLAPPPLVSPPQLPEGTLDADFDVATQGETLGEMLTALDGVLSAEVRDGNITGADLILTLEGLAEGHDIMTEEDGPLIPAAGRTEFDTIEARIDFARGLARLSVLRIRGQRYSIDMSGEADMEVGEIRGDGQARLHRNGSGAEGSRPLVDLPFGVGGSSTAPVVAAGVPRADGESAPEPVVEGDSE